MLKIPNDHLLNEIIDDLKKKHHGHTVILYGSRARDEATAVSDYDIIVIRDHGDSERDCRLFKGFYLDVFIYPESIIKHPDNYLIRAKDGIVLCQKNHFGGQLLQKINELFKQGPPKTPDWEKQEIASWLQKMLGRAKENDIEGNFRKHWLLHDLLECYFKLRDRWYLGPKESFKWLKTHDTLTYQAFDEALKLTAHFDSTQQLIDYVIESHKK